MNNIPKILHLMWDRSPMAYLQVLTVISFHKLNPDWAIKVYIPIQEVHELGANTYVPDYLGADFFYMLEELDYVQLVSIDLCDYRIRTDAHFILCSDQVRQQVLYKEGGLYSDFDVLWLRPISDLLTIDCLGNANDFEASICYHKDTYEWSNIAILFAEPKSGFVKLLIEEQAKIKPPYSHQIYGTDLVDKLFPRWELAQKAFPRMLNIRYKTFYPYDINNLKHLYVEDDIRPIEDKNVLCVHWFNGHKLSKAYINKGTYDQPCSMTSILKSLNYI